MKSPLIYWIFTLLIICDLYYCNSGVFRIATFESPPFVRYNNGRFEGYSIDLLNEIARRARIQYNLYLVRDGKHGQFNGTHWDGIIGELMQGRADMAIGDMIVNDDRTEFIDYSEPVLTFGVSAFAKKSITHFGMTFEDLIHSRLSYGIVKEGPVKELFKNESNPLVNRMWAQMTNDSLVESINEGLFRSQTTDYAFIGETPKVEYFTDNYCNLRLIRNAWPPTLHLRLGFPRDAPNRQLVDRAILQLKSEQNTRSSTLNYLYTKWFRSGCNSSCGLIINYILLLLVSLFPQIIRFVY